MNMYEMLRQQFDYQIGVAELMEEYEGKVLGTCPICKHKVTSEDGYVLEVMGEAQTYSHYSCLKKGKKNARSKKAE